MSKKILFIAAHRPFRSPSQRFRFEQYYDYLRENGFTCNFSWIISRNDDKVFYNQGQYLTKFFIFLKSYFTRLSDVKRAHNYDIVFVQREAFMTGTTYFERKFKKHAKLVFDFDDAIWHRDVSEANRRFVWLKRPEKTADIITIADLVIAGNNYLADFARHFNPSVVVIPTTIDTDYHVKKGLKKNDDKICIGWTGSYTTMRYIDLLNNVFKKLKEKYGEKIKFKFIGDGNYFNKELNIKGIPWQLETEMEDLQEIDIGIMPLVNNEWEKGKCGFKGLQYMALEIPPVMSPVGVNTEIIQEGVNGFLAASDNEWIEKISLLIENPQLRSTIGKAARETVIQKYSVQSQKENYLRCLKEVLNAN